MDLVTSLTDLAKISNKDRRTVVALLEKAGYDISSGNIDLAKLVTDYLDELSKRNDRRKLENKSKNDEQVDNAMVTLDDYRVNGPIHLQDPRRAGDFIKVLMEWQKYQESLGVLVPIQLIAIFLSGYIGRTKAIYDSFPQEISLIGEREGLSNEEAERFILVAKQMRNKLYAVNKEFFEKFTREFNTAVESESLQDFTNKHLEDIN